MGGSTYMDFVNKIRYQSNKLSSDSYTNSILAELRQEDVEFDPYEKVTFELTIPLEFSRFLLECIRMLRTCKMETPDFTNMNTDYVISLIYTGLCHEDFLLEIESVPIQATLLFLTLTSGKYVNVFDIEGIVYASLLKKALQVHAHRVALNRKVSVGVMLIWNKFIETSKNCILTNEIIDTLYTTLLTHTTSNINSFEIESPVHTSTAKAVFCCLKTVIKRQSSKDEWSVVTKVSLKLVENYGNNVLKQNVIRFFKAFLHEFSNQSWYFALLIFMFKRINDKELYVHIINQLPPEKHDCILSILLNNYVRIGDVEDLEDYLALIDSVIKIPYQDVPDDRRQNLVKRVVVETFFRSAHKSHVIKEHVMALFIKWCKMKDINVRLHLQLLFQTGYKAQAAQLFEILLQGVSISWKIPSYNVTFIIFTCRMFMLNKVFITEYRMRILEILCYKGTANCLRHCVPAIIELVKHYGLSRHPVLKPTLTLIIGNALNPTSTANYYIREFFDLLSNCMTAESDSELEFSICSVILSDDFNCLELFKTLQAHNLIRSEHIDVLLEEKILKHPTSWKLLSVLLDNIDYTKFPQYMVHYFSKIKTANFFTIPEAVYMLQVVSKIFMAKLKINVIEPDDIELAKCIDSALVTHIKGYQITAKHVGEALILLLTINKLTHSSMNWINEFFEETVVNVFSNINSDTVILARMMRYLERILVLLDINMEENCINGVVSAMSIECQRLIIHEQIHAELVTFFSKVCIKYNSRLTNAIPLLQYAMINGPAPVKLMAISSLYDVSNLYLHYFDPLYPGLLTLVKGSELDVKTVAVKILIKLINDNHIRLSCDEFITLMLVLVDRNYKLCLYFIDVFQSDFIYRNQHTICKYFINLLFYLNKYKNHPTYPVTLKNATGDFTYERRIIIYKFLFCNLERSNQLQILSALNSDFLLLFYQGRVDTTPNMWNILRDILTLVCFYASQYLSGYDILDIMDFYRELFKDMKRDFFTRKRFAERSRMGLDQTLEKLLLSILKLLYKIEKSNINMLPQFINTIGFATKAFYNKVIHMVHENTKLKDLYYELENCYDKHKQMIKAEPLDVLSYCDKEELRLYLESQM